MQGSTIIQRSSTNLTIFHAVVVAYYIVIDVCMGLVSLRLYETGHPVTQMFLGGCTQFFTSWNQASMLLTISGRLTYDPQVFQQSYFILSLVEDLLFYSTCKNHAHARQSIAELKQRFFGSILLPSACLTVINFWVIFWLVPHLMFDDLVAFYPGFLNHAMHTLVAPLVFLELLLTPQRAVTFRTGFSDISALMAAYAGWIYSLGWLLNQWPYPFLVAMSGSMHLVFVPSMFLHGYFWYFVCDTLIRSLWDQKDQRLKIN